MFSGIWRHKNCLDVDIEILRVPYRGPTYIKCKVIYWRRAFGMNKAFVIDYRPETVTIQRAHFNNWSYVK